MDSIRLEFPPVLTELYDANTSGYLVIEQKIKEGTTIGDLLRKLSNKHSELGNVIFADEGHLSGLVFIVLNGRILDPVNVLSTILNSGDIIELIPVIDGG